MGSNYTNRLRLAKVIVKNKMSRFMVHCVYTQLLTVSALRLLISGCGVPAP